MQDKSESLTGRAAQIHVVLFETQTTGDNSSLFFTVATDSTSWPCEEVIWIYLTKRKMKREKREREEGRNFWMEDIFSPLILYAHLIMLLTALEVK